MADQQELLEQQKAQCIFCKIVAGEIESLKVHEDDDFLAIMDIRPAAPGHVLLLPKEHIPILPVMPQEQQSKIFALAASLADAQKSALICESVTIMSASGHVAGQQAPHMMLHLIPREKGDGLEMLDALSEKVEQADAVALSPIFQQATVQVLEHLGRSDLVHKEEEEFSDPRAALMAMLEQNDELRKLIIAQPTMVEDYVGKSEKLKKLFEGVDIKALSRLLNQQEENSKKRSGEKQMSASMMSQEELFAFIDGNEGLRTWLLENPKELADKLSENPKLEAFFSGVDVVGLANAYREHWEARS